MRFFISAILFLSMSACMNIPYQPYKMMSGGYKDNALGDGVYSISYEMYGKVDPKLVLERWHLRASELCSKGYDVLESKRDDIKGSTMLASGGIFVPLSFSDPKYVGKVKCKE